MHVFAGNKYFLLLPFFLIFSFIILFIFSSKSNAQSFLVKITDTSQWTPPSPDPAGITYIPSSGKLLISDSEVEEMPNLYTGKNVYESSLSGTLENTYSTISFSAEPTDLAVNSANNHLFFSDDSKRKIFEIDLGPDAIFGTSDDIIRSFSTLAFGSNDPEGLGFGNGNLYISDGVGTEIYIVNPGANGIFDGVAPTGDDQVTHFDTLVFGQKDPEGVDYNPDSNTLFIVSRNNKSNVSEVTIGGQLVRQIDISFLGAIGPAGIAYGPRSNNPDQKSLYIVDRAVDNNNNPDENDGKLYEIAIDSAPPVPTPTPTIVPTATPTPTPNPIPTVIPTTTPAPTIISSTLTFNPTDDASIYSAYPAANYGSAAALEIDKSPVKNFLLKFTVNGVGTKQVTGAKIRLYNVGSSNMGGLFYASANNWQQSNVTWNTAPAAENVLLGSLGKVSPKKWYEVNIANYITGDGTYSLRISSTSTDGADYSSREGNASYIPQLVLALN